MAEKYESDPELEKKMKLEKTSEGKVIDIKGTSSGKKEEMETKMKETKVKMKEKKEDMSSKIHEVKKGASEKGEEVKSSLEDVKKEAEEQKEQLEKESEEEGMTPAEKILNDIVNRFKQGTGQINEAIYKEDESKNLVEKPLVDVIETNDTVTVIADISGLKKDDIDLGISKNSVEITAMFKEEPDDEDIKFTKKERSYGETHRKIMLSSEIKVHEAKANYKNCTLTIVLPKTVEDITKVDID
jgi:HSP20 family protein